MKDFSGEYPFEVWTRECGRCERAPHEAPHMEVRGEWCIEAAKRLLAVAHNLAGVNCPGCGGYGTKAYGNTTTWRGGVGGQAITEGVCDQCWGTGRTDKSGPNMRKVNDKIRQLETKIRQMEWRVGDYD